MRFTKEVIEQIGQNVITAVADPVEIDGVYYVSVRDFDKIADSIAYAIGGDFVIGLEYLKFEPNELVDIVVFDEKENYEQVTYWRFCKE